MRPAPSNHRSVGKPRTRRGSVLRSRPVADASGAPVLRDQGPIGRPGTARPILLTEAGPLIGIYNIGSEDGQEGTHRWSHVSLAIKSDRVVVFRQLCRLAGARDAGLCLLKGIAAVLWPLVVVVAIFVFRKELQALLARLRKAKFLGGELELDESLDQLERTAEALEASPTPKNLNRHRPRVPTLSSSPLKSLRRLVGRQRSP